MSEATISKSNELIIPISSVTETRINLEKQLASQNSGIKTESIQELARLMKIIENGDKTKLKDRKSYLNTLNSSEKSELLVKLRSTLLEQEKEINPNTILTELDNIIGNGLEYKMQQIQVGLKIEQDLSIDMTKFLIELDDILEQTKSISIQNIIPKIKDDIIFFADKNSDEKLNKLKTSIGVAKSLNDSGLTKVCLKIDSIISDINSQQSSFENLDKVFKDYSNLIGTNLNQALKMCNGERETIISYLNFINELNSDQIINKLSGLPKEIKEQVTLLIINQFHEIPNASPEKKLQVFTASMNFGLKALEAEAKTKEATANALTK